VRAAQPLRFHANTASPTCQLLGPEPLASVAWTVLSHESAKTRAFGRPCRTLASSAIDRTGAVKPRPSRAAWCLSGPWVPLPRLHAEGPGAKGGRAGS